MMDIEQAKREATDIRKIIAEAIFNSVSDSADWDAIQAEAVLTVLAERGFVIAPKEATEEMVDAAAREICLESGNDPDEECAPMGCDQWELYKTEARAAYAAAILKAEQVTEPEQKQIGYAVMHKPTILERFSRSLGFVFRLGEEPGDIDNFQGWAKSKIRIHFDILDRVRLLIGGRVHVDLTHYTDKPFDEMKTRVDIRIFAPWEESK